MSLSYDSALQLFRGGEYGAIATSVTPASQLKAEVDPRLKILVAHSLARVGRPAEARDLLGTETAHLPTPGLKSAAHIALGLANRSLGELERAITHLQQAVRLAFEDRDPERIAWAQLYLLRHSIDDGDIDVGQAMVQTVRMAVTRAGSPQATAYLHVTTAALEGQRGRLTEAWRHCEIAAGVLVLQPNVWLTCAIHQVQAVVAGNQLRLQESAAHLRSLGELAKKHQLARESINNEANIGHINHLRGEYKRSTDLLARVIGSTHSSTHAKLSAIETMARIHLAQGNLERCVEYLSQIEVASAQEPRASASHPVRWAGISRARLHLKRRDAPSATVLLGHAERSQKSSFDAQFASTLHLTMAHAMTRLNQPVDAAARLFSADSGGATRFKDVQGQYYYASAVAVEAANPDLADQLRQRARRLWAHQGIVSMEREMEDIPPPRRAARVTRKGPAAAINALGSAIDLAHSPRLLGDELAQTLASIDVEATITRDGTESDPAGDTISISLGTDADEPLMLRCHTPQQPELAVLVQDVLRIGRAAVELERYREDERKRTALWPEDPIEDQLGALFVSQEMQDLLNTVRRLAPTTVPVLITGETGTGKEVIARIIHAYSPRAKAPFLAFNCASTPRDMLDSQLFGHRRGAFTGAVEHFPGVIRTADRGTLLLDEIGDMPLDVQPKLLRFLESSDVHPVGEARPTKVDVRVIAATNARLESLVSSGQFREDLYYRLNIVELPIPPLRERRVDIPAIANHYLRKHAAEYRKRDLRLAEDAMEYLLLYRWPGNVRQLANEMRRLAAITESGAVIMPEHLSADIAASRRTVPTVERQPDPREVFVRLDQPLPAAVEYVERALIQHALKKCHGRVEEAATLLGMSRKGLYLKRQRYEIDPPAPSKTPQA
jgi:DNA-binding NtrC family response regulator